MLFDTQCFKCCPQCQVTFAPPCIVLLTKHNSSSWTHIAKYVLLNRPTHNACLAHHVRLIRQILCNVQVSVHLTSLTVIHTSMYFKSRFVLVICLCWSSILSECFPKTLVVSNYQQDLVKITKIQALYQVKWLFCLQ